MKKRYKLTLFFLLLIVLYNSFLLEFDVVGKYKNVNFYSNSIAEQANKEDILELFPNGRFYSPFYGEGKYELEYNLFGTTINLSPDDERKAGINNTICRKYFMGKPKIILFRDLDQHYIKIDL